MEEEQVGSIKEAMKSGLDLLVYQNQFGRIETSLITIFEDFPYTTITSTQMPTDVEALIWLNEAHKNGRGVLGNYYSRPIREKINPRHAWVLQGERFVGKYKDGIYRFHAIRIWDNKTVETSEGRLFVPTYIALDLILTDLSFKRANDSEHMFNW